MKEIEIDVNVNTSEMDIALEKANELSAKIKETKSLADELASCLAKIDLHLDI